MGAAEAAVAAARDAGAAMGFDLVEPADLDRYNAACAERGTPAMVAPRGNTRGALVLLLGASSRLWPAFLDALAQDGALQRCGDPLDAYTERCALSIAEVAHRAAWPSGGGSARVIFAHRPSREVVSSAEEATDATEGRGGDAGPARYIAIQRLAEVAGVAALDADTHLCIHPTFGPWFSLRAAVVLDGVPVPAAVRDRQVPAVDMPPEDVARRAAELWATIGTSYTAARERWRELVEVRRAAAPGHPWEYGEDQTRYHYTADVAFLRTCVARGRTHAA
ncbi:unnamed protein product [Pedinophyceae sp. YPF-701]|nr:unnamed protein product [Pedinophyceae sp. YPF-701]